MYTHFGHAECTCSPADRSLHGKVSKFARSRTAGGHAAVSNQLRKSSLTPSQFNRISAGFHNLHVHNGLRARDLRRASRNLPREPQRIRLTLSTAEPCRCRGSSNPRRVLPSARLSPVRASRTARARLSSSARGGSASSRARPAARGGAGRPQDRVLSARRSRANP